MIRFLKNTAIVLLSLFFLSAGDDEPRKNTALWEISEPFPSLFFTDRFEDWLINEGAKPYWAATEMEAEEYIQSRILPIYFNNDIIVFYGSPLSRNMGILGRYEIDELNTFLNVVAAEYNEVNGQRGVRKAFYIIYGTVQPGGEINYIPDAVLQKYIRFALEHDMLIFIDHQIGRYNPINSLKVMLPYLHYPNVHLALDPEWRTDKPMKEIGSVTAAELIEAQEIIAEYLEKHRLPENRMLVIHQFNYRMIENRMDVRTGLKRVTLIHCADGFGSPPLKRSSYEYNAQARNMPVKGFKLFYNFGIPGAGYDDPLMTPTEVIELNPRPYVIIYQ